MSSKDRSDNKHIEEVTPQSDLHNDIEEAKAQANSIYEVLFPSYIMFNGLF